MGRREDDVLRASGDGRQRDHEAVRRVTVGRARIAALLTDALGPEADCDMRDAQDHVPTVALLGGHGELKRLVCEPGVTCVAVPLPAWAADELVWARDCGAAPVAVQGKGWLLPFTEIDPSVSAADLAIVGQIRMECVDFDLAGLQYPEAYGMALLSPWVDGYAEAEARTPPDLRSARGALSALALRELTRVHSRIVWVGPECLWTPIEEAILGGFPAPTHVRTVERRPTSRYRLSAAILERFTGLPAMVAAWYCARHPFDHDDARPWRAIVAATEAMAAGRPCDDAAIMQEGHVLYTTFGEELQKCLVAEARARTGPVEGPEAEERAAARLAASEQLLDVVCLYMGDAPGCGSVGILPILHPAPGGGVEVRRHEYEDPEDAAFAAETMGSGLEEECEPVEPEERRTLPDVPEGDTPVRVEDTDDALCLEGFIIRAMEFASSYSVYGELPGGDWGDLRGSRPRNGKPSVSNLFIDFVDLANAGQAYDVRRYGEDWPGPRFEDWWFVHPSNGVGVVTRRWGDPLLLDQGEAKPLLVWRAAAFASLDHSCSGARSRLTGFVDKCVMPLDLICFRGDRLEGWLQTWIEASAGTTLAYISKTPPGPAAAELAQKNRVEILYIPIDALPPEAVARVAAFTITTTPWSKLKERGWTT
jgi:hypothetical protein